MKKTIRLISLALVLALLAACGDSPAVPQNTPQQPQQTEQPPAQQGTEPAQAQQGTEPAQTQQGAEPVKTEPEPPAPAYEPQPVFRDGILNGTVIDEHSENDEAYAAQYDTYKNCFWVTISGLKEESVENAINGDIMGMYNKANRWEIPPFRGTAQVDPKDYEGGSKYFNINDCFNINDYLSLQGSYTIYQRDGDYPYLSYCDFFTATYDLRTGKKLALRDLFAEGYPYEDIINKRVMEYLDSENAQEEFIQGDDEPYYEDSYKETFVKLVAPFKGIREDQRYYLTNYGLCVVLDYNDKAIDISGFYITPVTVQISYGDFYDGLLLGRGSDPSIYTDASKQCRYLMYSLGGEEVREVKKLYEGPYNIDFEEQLTYPEQLPEELLKQVRVKLAANRQQLQPYIRACEEAEDPEDKYFYGSNSCYVEGVGNYYIANFYTDTPPLTDGAEYTNTYSNMIWDLDLEPVAAGDMFQSGFDWQSYLAEKFRTSFEEQLSYGYSCDHEPDFRALAADPRISISNDSIGFRSSGRVKMYNYQYGYDTDFEPYCYIYFHDDDAMLLNIL